MQQTYAVTYPDEQQQPKTFFITLLMQRSDRHRQRPGGLDPGPRHGGVRPPGW